MEPEQPIQVDTPAVRCDGDGDRDRDRLGHGAGDLKTGASGETVCPYCSRRFVLAAGAKEAAGH